MNEEMIQKYSNTCIEVDSREHGAKVISFYETLGFPNPLMLEGSSISTYYGERGGRIDGSLSPWGIEMKLPEDWETAAIDESGPIEELKNLTIEFLAKHGLGFASTRVMIREGFVNVNISNYSNDAYNKAIGLFMLLFTSESPGFLEMDSGMFRIKVEPRNSIFDLHNYIRERMNPKVNI